MIPDYERSCFADVDGGHLCRPAETWPDASGTRSSSCWSRCSAAIWPAPDAARFNIPRHILKRQLTPEECFKAVDECGTPMVSIPGGEPLLHPQIDEIVEGLVARKKYIYLCTNALLLKEKIHLFKPSKYLTFSVHLDGQAEHHDMSVCLEGGHRQGHRRNARSVEPRLPRDHQHDFVRRRRSQERARLLRRNDGDSASKA